MSHRFPVKSVHNLGRFKVQDSLSFSLNWDGFFTEKIYYSHAMCFYRCITLREIIHQYRAFVFMQNKFYILLVLSLCMRLSLHPAPFKTKNWIVLSDLNIARNYWIPDVWVTQKLMVKETQFLDQGIRLETQELSGQQTASFLTRNPEIQNADFNF